MKKINSLPDNVNIISQIADLKENDYTNLLFLTSLIELLIEKGIITHQELANITSQADDELSNLLS